MSEEEKKSEAFNLLNKSAYVVKSFSVPKDKLQVLAEFCEITRREGGTFSEAVIRALEEYNQRHRAGNPQLLLTHYVKPDEPQPMRVLCVFCQGALSEGQIYCQNKGMWIPGVVCYSCKHNRLRKHKTI